MHALLKKPKLVKYYKMPVGEIPGLARRLEAGLEKSGECWIWTKFRNHKGYGQIGVRDTLNMAHRVAYCIAHGASFESIQGKFVCHKCDNPPCCNPDHLFLGTAADNSRDMSSKGRHRVPMLRGEDHPMAKLTRHDVAVIRSLGGSVPQRNLARQFGVSQTHIYRILKGKSHAAA